MADFLDMIRRNAQSGEGPCAGCSAHESGGCEFVNPGLSNPEGRIMFITVEPSHAPKWSKHDSWESYNGYWAERFKQLPGGKFVDELISPLGLTLDDVWIADSIKCPTVPHAKRGIPGADTADAFDHCRTYLRYEIDFIDPEVIVTLGKHATTRTLQVLGVPDKETRGIRVSEDYGPSSFDTPYPLVIGMQWAQRTLPRDEWVPVVRDGIRAALREEPDATERFKQTVFAEIERHAARLDLPDAPEQIGKSAYANYVTVENAHSGLEEVFALAALYLGVRATDYPFALSELVATTEYKELTVMRVFRRIADETGLDIGLQNPKLFVDRIAAELPLTDTRIPEMAKRIIDATPQAQQGNRAKAIAAGAFYLASKRCNQKIKQELIADAADVSTLTIRNRYQEMEAALPADSA